MAAADRMLREVKHDNPLHIYHCPTCTELYGVGIHIGHLAKGESNLMMEGYSINIRDLQGIKDFE